MVFLTWARSFAVFFGYLSVDPRDLPCFPTRRSSDLGGALGSFLAARAAPALPATRTMPERPATRRRRLASGRSIITRSEEHTSELQSLRHLVCRLLLEKKKSSVKSAQTDNEERCGSS